MRERDSHVLLGNRRRQKMSADWDELISRPLGESWWKCGIDRSLYPAKAKERSSEGSPGSHQHIEKYRIVSLGRMTLSSCSQELMDASQRPLLGHMWLR